MSYKCGHPQVNILLNHYLGCISGWTAVGTCVSRMWNMSAPLPASRLGILISTVDPGSLLGPLFMAWNHIRQEGGKDGDKSRREVNTQRSL